MTIPHLPRCVASEARERLAALGWTPLAEGDWSWVDLAPDGESVVRITPWDDGYRLHAQMCAAHPEQPHLQRVRAIVPLAGEAYAVFQERLFSCDGVVAESFCAALGFPRDTDRAGPSDPAQIAAFAALPSLAALRALLADLVARASKLPFFGGTDIRPGNLMCDEAGRIKTIDPIFVAGRRIHAAIEAGDGAALRTLPLAKLESFLTIPVFKPGPETDALRARLARAYHSR